MCTVVVDRRPDNSWPVLIGANRDEMETRPWQAPARHWPDRPEVVAGLDEEAGGSWLGVNDWGVFACLLNRFGTLGPQAGKRSRGELVLEALDHADAVAAAEAMKDLNPEAYRPFNLLIIDNRDGFWIRHADEAGKTAPQIHPIPDGLSIFTALDRNDEADPRIRHHLPLFEAAVLPQPDPDADGLGDWQAWEALLASRERDADSAETAAMCFRTERGFATSSSALLALPTIGLAAPDGTPRGPILRFCPRKSGSGDGTESAPEWQTLLPE
ncbi:MAG: NRDE family protein [Rhodospirillaceae bacterium]